MTNNDTKPRVWPGLQYDDARTALTTLTEVFGFTETLVVPGENDLVAHAELRWPDGGGVMLGSVKASSGAHEGQRSGGSSVYVNTDAPSTVDAVYERCRAAGLRIVQELTDTDYGSHGFTVADQEGNSWTFGTYAGA
ncbi:putative glyoxalase superfamily protein PhnB [Herbihabitans rhizosphaerae]|uniref:Putative glyoxalase superfamily protein PhnB n=1 Tax=Herbihabitans rhizosphaerae TaxID=1872711 RepID=A0A4Q7KHG3_9PSEU|nr:VOC family protein [Herbihabitans rhizosphaerae]RZS34713.1 putative glyoxalase superfamily protein PhnB [Herbihabitans rhizosphaerae]